MCHKIIGKGKCHKKCFLHNKAHERKANDAEEKRWINFKNNLEKAASGKKNCFRTPQAVHTLYMLRSLKRLHNRSLKR